MQVETGIRSILKAPIVYEAWQSALGANRKRNIQRDDYIRPFKGMNIFDIGCGPAEILNHLEDVNYLGADLSAPYIEQAKNKYGEKGEFFVGSADALPPRDEKFDLVMALGLLHHLEDEECIALFETAKKQLVSKGRMMTFDGVFTEKQSSLARFFLNKDRGQNVRFTEGYTSLAKQVFGEDNVVFHVRTDMTNIPYTHIIMECTAE